MKKKTKNIIKYCDTCDIPYRKLSYKKAHRIKTKNGILYLCNSCFVKYKNFMNNNQKTVVI